MRVAPLALALLLAADTAAWAQSADPRMVVDPRAPPWDAVAKVQTNTAIRCTGVLSAPAIVLTAAHCLYNRLTRAMLQPVSLHVLFGYERGAFRWQRQVARVDVGTGFAGTGPQPQQSDWARLELTESVPVPPLSVFKGEVAAGTRVALAGYNQDRAQLLMVDPDCRVKRVGGRFVVHDCAGTRGTSGGPLLTQDDGRWEVVGINIAAGSKANLAVMPP